MPALTRRSSGQPCVPGSACSGTRRDIRLAVAAVIGLVGFGMPVGGSYRSVRATIRDRDRRISTSAVWCGIERARFARVAHAGAIGSGGPAIDGRTGLTRSGSLSIASGDARSRFVGASACRCTRSSPRPTLGRFRTQLGSFELHGSHGESGCYDVPAAVCRPSTSWRHRHEGRCFAAYRTRVDGRRTARPSRRRARRRRSEHCGRAHERTSAGARRSRAVALAVRVEDRDIGERPAARKAHRSRSSS